PSSKPALTTSSTSAGASVSAVSTQKAPLGERKGRSNDENEAPPSPGTIDVECPTMSEKMTTGPADPAWASPAQATSAAIAACEQNDERMTCSSWVTPKGATAAPPRVRNRLCVRFG